MDDESTLLDQLLNWGIRHAKTNAQRECAWHMVAAIVNKHSAGDERLSSVSRNPADVETKIWTLFSTLRLPRFGTRRLPSRWTLSRGVVLFRHGHGYKSYCSLWCVITHSSRCRFRGHSWSGTTHGLCHSSTASLNFSMMQRWGGTPRVRLARPVRSTRCLRSATMRSSRSCSPMRRVDIS